MRILLVQCPCGFNVEMPPLALASLYSAARAGGHQPKVLDLSAEICASVADDRKEYWHNNRGSDWYLDYQFEKLDFITPQTYEFCCEKILAARPQAVGFSVQNTSILFTLKLAEMLRQRSPRTAIILGGPNCYPLSCEGDFRIMFDLQKQADVVVVGEGERTLPEVLRCLERRQPLERVPGIAFRSGERFVFTGMPEPIGDLDSLPLPDFDSYDLSLYWNKTGFPIMSSRGCVMKCVFCTDTNFWGRYRARCPENVVKEMALLKWRYRRHFFAFNDSLVNGSRDNFMKLCSLLVEKKMGIRWRGNCRIDRGLGREQLALIKDSGCECLVVGAESASNRILALMRKGFTIEDVERFAEDCRDAGIAVDMNWVVGFPGETEEDFAMTRDFIRSRGNLIFSNTFSTLTINQFSYLEQHPGEFGVVMESNHRGLWRSVDGTNNIDSRVRRLRELEGIEQARGRPYSVVRQKEKEYDGG